MCTAFRNPALLAKMADAVDEVSGGRLILGLGAGWHEPEFTAFGYPFDHLASRFEDALRIIAPLVRKGEVDFSGTYERAVDAVSRPRGPRPEGPPILIGASQPRMLRLTAELADAWNTCWLGRAEELPEKLAPLREACAQVGRDPATLEVTVGQLATFPGLEQEWAQESEARKGNLLRGRGLGRRVPEIRRFGSGASHRLADAAGPEVPRFGRAGTAHLSERHRAVNAAVVSVAQANGIAIAYRHWPAPTAAAHPPVVLLHGVLQSSEGMRHLAERLALDGEVLVPDLRGRGDSDRPEAGYEPATMADDVAALIPKLGIDRPVLIGRLHGGLVAYHLAAQVILTSSVA